MIKLRNYGGTAQVFFCHKMNKSASIGRFSPLIKLKFMKINKTALSAGGKSLFLWVTIVLLQARSDLYGITIL